MIRKRVKRVLLLILPVAMGVTLLSCSLLGSTSFFVQSWLPGEGRYGEAGTLSIRVVFSEIADTCSVEEAFSLTENGFRLDGDYSWDGPALSFEPYAELENNADYTLTIGAQARNTAGASLATAFEGRFTTRADDVRPRVLSTAPVREGCVADTRGEISITFNKAIASESYRSHLSVSPAIGGVWSLSAEGTVAVFTPLSPWEKTLWYELQVSSEVEDCAGNRAGAPFSSRFRAGEDGTPPMLIEAVAVTSNGDAVETLCEDDASGSARSVNEGWESGYALMLRFSEPVVTRTIASRVSCEGGTDPRMVGGDAVAAEVVFEFDDPVAWGDEFLVRVRPGIEDENGNSSEDEYLYRIIADGAASKPPLFVGIRIPLSPGASDPAERNVVAFPVNEPYETLHLASDPASFPVDVATAVSLELYFRLAEGATLDALSLMEFFKLSSTNDALRFRSIKILPAGLPWIAPPEGWHDCAIARVDG
ncbi:MAG: Ig-like domain-containing protein, partial [Spirochaetales bacterium]|nr:Ig-like domain-containing protein [Spirochaetales bacterium]